MFWQKNFKTAFSVIEILIGIFILVMVFSLSLVVLKNLNPEFVFGGSARELINDLKYLQQLTVSEQKKYCLKFFPLEKKYQLTSCDQNIFLKEVVLPEEIKEITLEGFSDNQVEFNPYGAVKEAGEIRLENSRGMIKIIEIKPSGFLRVK